MDKIRKKTMNGYLTVEAAHIIPLVLVIYLLIITAALYLYDKCVISGDNYLLAMRGSRFTQGEVNYGEIIFGEMEKGSFEEEYLIQRAESKSQYYPLYHQEMEKVFFEAGEVCVLTKGFGGLLIIEKRAEQINPLEIVKRVRMEENQ